MTLETPLTVPLWINRVMSTVVMSNRKVVTDAALVLWLFHAYPPHRAAGTCWRSVGCLLSQPCSRTLPDAPGWGSAGRSPWWGHRSPAYCWLWSPLEGPLCARRPWPACQSHDREPQQACRAAGTRSRSGWQRGRRGCLCLFRGTNVWHRTLQIRFRCPQKYT